MSQDCASCTVCNHGFSLDPGSKVCHKCTDFDPNCDLCDFQGKKCTLCKSGFGLNFLTQKCEACYDTNAKECSIYGSIQQIVLCKDNYYVKSDGFSCVPKCESDEFVGAPEWDTKFESLKKLQCKPCDLRCNSCFGDSQTCTSCN